MTYEKEMDALHTSPSKCLEDKLKLTDNNEVIISMVEDIPFVKIKNPLDDFKLIDADTGKPLVEEKMYSKAHVLNFVRGLLSAADVEYSSFLDKWIEENL